MNIRKPVDYSTMFAELDKLIAAELPQMELYCGIGHIVSSRPEKGAAVAAAEYLRNAHPDASGFSPRYLRRMREFYRTYENTPEVMAEAMSIGWTQNVVILEAELALPAREWYIHASGQFCWSKLALLKAIKERIHETIAVYSDDNPCHSHVTGSDENGSEESSGTLLQCLRVAEIQRELQRDGRYNSHTRNLLPTFTGIAGGAHDTPMLGKSAATSHEREQNDMAEELHTRPVHRMSGTCLHGLSRKTPSPGVKSEKIGVVNNKTGAVHKQQSLRSLWRSCVYTRKLHCHPEASPYNIRTPQISKSQPVLLQAVRQSPNDSV